MLSRAAPLSEILELTLQCHSLTNNAVVAILPILSKIANSSTTVIDHIEKEQLLKLREIVDNEYLKQEIRHS